LVLVDLLHDNHREPFGIVVVAGSISRTNRRFGSYGPVWTALPGGQSGQLRCLAPSTVPSTVTSWK
jgi:hypothetical protein